MSEAQKLSVLASSEKRDAEDSVVSTTASSCGQPCGGVRAAAGIACSLLAELEQPSETPETASETGSLVSAFPFFVSLQSEFNQELLKTQLSVSSSNGVVRRVWG